MKKQTQYVIFIMLTVVFVIYCILTQYYTKFSITGTESEFKESIRQLIGPSSRNIKFKQSKKIHNQIYFLFTCFDEMGDAELGYAHFTKGLNGKYKQGFISAGSSPILYQVVKINRAKYFIISGQNPGMKISYLKLLLDEKEYKIDVAKQKYFFIFCQVPKSTKVEYPDIKNISFFDSNSNVITDEVLSQ